MARNGSGTYAVPNSFSSGTTISSASVNANFTDVGSELTNSLPRDGQAGMTGPFKAASGTLAAPGIAYSSDTDTGWRRSADGTQRAVSNGSDVMEVGPSGLTMQSGKTITDENSNVVVGLPTGLGPMPWTGTTAPTGWVRCNGRTIGNASSAATERANADTEDLFTHLWTNYANAELAVSSGRGVSAAADYAANKTIALPDMKGRTFFGLDDMGASAAGRLGSAITSATTNGATGGAETTTLSITHMPAHDHGGGSHTHVISQLIGGGTWLNDGTVNTAGSVGYFPKAQNSTGTNSTNTPSTTVISSQGSGTAFSNMPPAFLGTWIIKL